MAAVDARANDAHAAFLDNLFAPQKRFFESTLRESFAAGEARRNIRTCLAGSNPAAGDEEL